MNPMQNPATTQFNNNADPMAAAMQSMAAQFAFQQMQTAQANQQQVSVQKAVEEALRAEKAAAQNEPRMVTRSGGNGGGFGGRNRTVTCFACGEEGHMSYNCPKRGQQQMQQGMQQQQVQQPTQQLAQQQQPDMAAMAREVAREVARSMAEQMGTTTATSPRVDAGNREEMAVNPIVQSVMDPMQLAQFKEGLLKDIKDMVDEAVADTQDTVQQGQKTLEKSSEHGLKDLHTKVKSYYAKQQTEISGIKASIKEMREGTMHQNNAMDGQLRKLFLKIKGVEDQGKLVADAITRQGWNWPLLETRIKNIETALKVRLPPVYDFGGAETAEAANARADAAMERLRARRAEGAAWGDRGEEEEEEEEEEDEEPEPAVEVEYVPPPPPPPPSSGRPKRVTRGPSMAGGAEASAKKKKK